MTQRWQSGLCDCFDDWETCLPSFFCPCVQFGVNASVVGERCGMSCALYLLLAHFYCCCLVHAPVRTKIRARYHLQGDEAEDCLATLCGCTSIAQEAREIKARGPPPAMAMPAIAMHSTHYTTTHPTPYAAPAPAPLPPPPPYSETEQQQSEPAVGEAASDSRAELYRLQAGADFATIPATKTVSFS